MRATLAATLTVAPYVLCGAVLAILVLRREAR
jgi:hypothetical protein